MTVTAASLMVKVGADTAMAQQGLTGLAGMLGKSGILTIGALATTAAIAGIGLASAKMAGDYQADLTSLVTGAGEAKSNIQLVSDGILQMAKDTGTSTKQLTDGLYMIESAGYHGQAGLDVLKSAAEGAKVGSAQLGTVADAVTTVMKDYSDQNISAATATNTLIATVANGKTHLEDLAGALSHVLPTASAAGIGLNDTMAAMATMTGEGVDAANAATYLRQTIIALSAPADVAKQAMADVGLSSDEVAATMQKSLPDALKMVTDAVGSKFPVGSAKYIEAIKNISGGAREMQGMLDLTGQHMTDFQANVVSITGAAQKGGSTIAGWSDVQDTFNFKFDKAKEVVQTLMIELGTHLLPVLGNVALAFAANLVPTINHVVTAVTTVIGVGQGLIRFFQDTGPASTAVKVVLGILAGALLGLAASAIPAAITSVVASITAFYAQAVAATTAAVATLAAAAPFILIGAAIAAVVAIVILAVTHWQQITAAFNDFFSSASPVKLIIVALLGPLGLVIGAVALAKQHWSEITGVLGGFKDMIGAVLGFIGNLISRLGDLNTAVTKTIEGAKNIPVLGGVISHLPGFASGTDSAPGGPAMLGEGGEPELVTGPGVGNLARGARVIPWSQLANQQGSIAGAGLSGGGGGSGQSVTIPITLTLDGRMVTQVVVKHMPSVVRNSTGVRSM